MLRHEADGSIRQENAIVQVQHRDARVVLRHEADGRIGQEIAIAQVQLRDARAVLRHEADGGIRQEIAIVQVQHRDGRAVLRHEADRFIREIWCSVYSHNIGLVLQNESLNLAIAMLSGDLDASLDAHREIFLLRLKEQAKHYPKEQAKHYNE